MTQVLIVDDDEDTRVMLRHALEDVGHEVLEAANGLRALKLLSASQRPFVVLLDNWMPGLDGVDLLELLEADGEQPGRHAFILVTASPQKVSLALHGRLKALGVPLVSKPFDLDDLLDLVVQADGRLGGG